MKNDHIAELEKRMRVLEKKFLTVDSLAKEVVVCQKMEAQLQLRLQFEEIITEISIEFINLLPSDLDCGINHALQKVGAFARADRCYVFQLTEDGAIIKNTHEYCAPGISPRIATLAPEPAADYSWAMGQLRDKGYLRIKRLSDFPAQAGTERQKFLDNGLSASVAFALRVKDRLAGFVGFDWVSKFDANSAHIAALLNTLGVIIANALERQRLEQSRENLISELRHTQENLLTLSIRDQLTGLFNRRHMEESLAREISRAVRHKTFLTIIMLDLDFFKKINDNYGHMAGDLVLGAMGRFLLHRSRGEDVVCRYGGEEFVVIMPGADLESGIKRAEDIRLEVQDRLRIKYRGAVLPGITVSLGVASYPEHGATADLLLYNVDNALYKAKQAGRNRVVSA